MPRSHYNPKDSLSVKSDYYAHIYSQRDIDLIRGDLMQRITELTTERDALRGDVQAAIDTIKQNQANPTDKYVEQRTMYLLDRLTTALAAQLKEQDDG